jgi:hypothetical protein
VYLLLKEGIKVSVPETDSTPHPGPTGVELNIICCYTIF